jgi:RecA-family ATPase
MEETRMTAQENKVAAPEFRDVIVKREQGEFARYMKRRMKAGARRHEVAAAAFMQVDEALAAAGVRVARAGDNGALSSLASAPAKGPMQ